MFVAFVTRTLSVLAIGAQIFLLLGVVYFLLLGGGKGSWLGKLISQNAIKFGFIVALVATAGSLFFSEVAGFEPCRLCWFQRIFMYPQVILLGLAWLKKDNKIIEYSLVLAVTGAFISLYHNYIYYAAQKTAVCSLAVPCTTPYALEFGYITIPMMALTAFLCLIFLFSVQKAFGNSK
ncbi:MAG TPA: disulfide oxidoreductase [Patescibacteria group bacterium]